MYFPEGLEKYSFHKAVGYNVASCHFFFSDARPDQQKSVLFLSCTSTKEAYFVTFSRQFLASTWQLSYLSRVRPLPVQNSGVSSLGVPGVPWHTLFQPRGTDYAHLIKLAPPGFSDLPKALGLLIVRKGWLKGLIVWQGKSMRCFKILRT